MFDVSVLMIALPPIMQSQFNLIVQRSENPVLFTKGFISLTFLVLIGNLLRKRMYKKKKIQKIGHNQCPVLLKKERFLFC